ncbi:AVAST type 2 anti-phage system protein Avs2 [Fodinibius sediminis]|uniref:ATP-binding protein n=1 Tax=Fodinibius sediminis TaxID=1214077 RepID=A0A521ATF9_9BACT|nr:AVAST type 2 anti-phage system protein Avs2 [Fodinibius sediminis]SMO38087.1 hypothetical protein SAMN06265218_101360 [Fodinibius sediminis]
MGINWDNIRPLNGNKFDGFEELVCQLARREELNDQKSFRRVGNPDAGKECFWKFEDGEIYCWQAKYFTKSLSSSEWKQVDGSVKKCIDNHPDLTKYYVAIPYDMPDGKSSEQKSMLDKWDEKVEEWKAYARENGLGEVEFEYWGNHELITRISLPENQGLKYFWFNEDEFRNQWFEQKNKQSFDSLGSRYTPELNVKLPISKVFDGLSRNSQFEEEVIKQYREFCNKYGSLSFDSSNGNLDSLKEALKQGINEFQILFESINLSGNEKIPYDSLKTQLDKISDTCGEISNTFFELRADEEEGKDIEEIGYYGRPFGRQINKLDEFSIALNEFKEFLDSTICELSNRPNLIVTGKAGVGKSHLLADVVRRRKEKGLLSLFILGENFSTRQMPWTQILNNQLRRNHLDEFTFLDALNAKAESIGSRIILFIDALNEGQGRFIWPSRLKSFIEIFDDFDWLGVVVSIRNSYENLIAPQDEIDSNVASREEHTGFLGIEYEASKQFFEEYEILQPSVPLLHPEFQNPLFLKLFCQSLNKRGLKEIPPGYEGITTIINYYIESIDHKLSKPDQLHYDFKTRLVKKAIEKVIIELVDRGKNYIQYNEANEIINSVFQGNCANQEPYLKRLISEGVFNVDLAWDEEQDHQEVVYFAYERFQDHLTVSLLLDENLDLKNLEESVQEGKLQELLKDEQTARHNQNLIDALSIQVPERTNKELYQIFPHCKHFYSVAEGFVNSILWRKTDSFNEGTEPYLKDVILKNERLFYRFINEMIATAMKPNFPFNADRLHRALEQYELAQRDSLWTTWLQNKYDRYNRTNSVNRLIEWAWNNNDKGHIDDESIRLGAICLGWFLTSSNRYLRDAASSALVNLLQNRTYLIEPILSTFENVDDPYVTERLYAVAYGSILRSDDTSHLVQICEFIYSTIFDTEFIFPNILLRDYAREIVEYALQLGLEPNISIDKVRPPYKSESLPDEFPSIEEIDEKYQPKGESGHYGNENWGSGAILRSMATEYGRGTASYGDFGRYVFQAAFKNWNIDYDGLSNYAVQQIFELGYKPDLFNNFDQRQGTGRGSGHNERIGKKYQWIIFYELLARVSDHFELSAENSSGFYRGSSPELTEYQGPWYPYVRDFDPTLIIKKTQKEHYDEYSSNWWFDVNYSNWIDSNKEWVEKDDDVPDPKRIIESTDLKEQDWVWLNLKPIWLEPKTLRDCGARQISKKQLWYHINSYLIHKDKQEELLTRFNDWKFRGVLPQVRDLFQVFSREYYWSAAYKYFNSSFHRGENWSRVRNYQADEVYGEVAPTAEYFLWEEEYDCSKTEGAIAFYKPTYIIKNGLNLVNGTKEGQFNNSKGELICFDPSIYNDSISGLLVKKLPLINFLEENDLTIFWQVFGEKIGSRGVSDQYDGRLNVYGIYGLENEEIFGGIQTKLENW